jgi:hypothetical protein
MRAAVRRTCGCGTSTGPAAEIQELAATARCRGTRLQAQNSDQVDPSEAIVAWILLGHVWDVAHNGRERADPAFRRTQYLSPPAYPARGNHGFVATGISPIVNLAEPLGERVAGKSWPPRLRQHDEHQQPGRVLEHLALP